LILPDVNVLVYAHREDAVGHDEYRDWLASAISGESAYGMSDLVLSGFLRIVTHPRIFAVPSPLEDAQAFCEQVREQPNRVSISPGAGHWPIYTRLLRDAGARGNLVPDAFLAAMAMEHGCKWITADRDFARFDGLRCSHPLRPGN